MPERPKLSIVLYIILVSAFFSNLTVSQPALKSRSDLRSRDYWPMEDWKISEPEKLRMDANWLELLRMHIPEKLPQIRSVLVVRHGYIVFEEYYKGTDKNSLQDAASITKSITSALTGIAVKDGSIGDAEMPVAKYFSEYPDTTRASQFKEITLRHLLTMTSGFEWSDNDFPRFMESQNQIRFAINLPFAEKPGEKFNYNTPAVHLLSYLITKGSGKKLSEFADERLFKPLGISKYDWPADSQGLNLGGNGMSMRTRDLAKIGYLYLNKGKWGNRQIVPAEWVDESVKEQNEGGQPEGERYGYLWWVTNIKSQPAYFAGGYGGQFICVVPDLDLVVVITSIMDKPHIENRGIIGEFIIPAVEK